VHNNGWWGEGEIKFFIDGASCQIYTYSWLERVGNILKNEKLII
jgi:hypothetical protein